MKPRNREVSIFNMSVLDLLTGALGAFCFLTLALFPSYFKVQSADSAAVQDAVAKLKRINQSLKNEFAASGSRQGGMPPFAMANAGASDPQSYSCGYIRIVDATGPGGKAAIKMLPVNVSNGYSTSANFFLLAPGQYQFTMEAQAQHIPCKLTVSEILTQGYRSSSADLTTSIARYTLPLDVKSEDLAFAKPAPQ